MGKTLQMSFNGRSLDDLPLAAYTTGVAPDEDESLDSAVDPDLVEPPAPTQQDLAAALADSVVATSEPEKKAKRARPSLKLPSFRRSRTAALQAAAPFQPVAAGAPAASFQAVSASAPAVASFQPAAAFQAAPAYETVTRPGVLPQPAQPKVGVAKRPRPRLALRDPRVLAGGVIVIGLGLLGFSLLSGGGPAGGGAGASASQDAGGLVPTAAPMGDASIELTDAMAGIHNLTGASGG